MSVRWSESDLKAVGWTGTGFGNRRRVYKTPDGSLVDSRGLTVNRKDTKASPEPALDRPVARPRKKSVREHAAGQKRAVEAPVTLEVAIEKIAKMVCDPAEVIKRLPRSKFRNVRTNGYASKREADRAAELKLLEQGGRIRNLREQVDFELIPKQGRERAVKYRADFCYDELGNAGWSAVTEDVKGMRTPYFVLKRKLMMWFHGIVIRET